jgi:hypothetical protein
MLIARPHPCRAASVDNFFARVQKTLDFAKNSDLNTSLMHSGGEKTEISHPLGGIFQVFDFKGK